jgi:hypothetical protein
MLYAIHMGSVEGYNGGQASVVHLVFEVEHVVRDGLTYVFTDGHADMALSRFFDVTTELDHIDWQIMRERYWSDTDADGDRTRRRQAEFRVHQFVPWSLCTEIGVINARIEHEVSSILQAATHRPRVIVRRQWYY